MRNFRWLLTVAFFLTLTFPAAAKGKDKAQLAFNKGDYQTALALWSKTISKYEKHNKGAQCPVYAKAAEAALKLGKEGEARDLLQKAVYSASATPEAFLELAKLYRKIDNLSLEITTLEKYVKKYPGDSHMIPVQERLFDTYIESENWQQALELWKKLQDNFRNSPKVTAKLLKAQLALDNTRAADTLAQKVLKSNPENLFALRYEAKKYFWRAENRYQAEMKAYNHNKTRRQYAHLLNAFKIVTADFKKSLTYFRKLYKLQPTAENARYLGNIYARLDDRSKAKYYQNLAGKLKKEEK
jgi:tetratricopeptide (TPR) repeat protein